MKLSGKYITIVLVMALAAACSNSKKKTSLSGDDPVDVRDFIEFFQPVKLSYSFGDTILSKKEKDSTLISYKVFTQFIPDTILSKVYGKGIRPKIYPIGKAIVSEDGNYLFIKTVTPEKKAAWIAYFDKKNRFIAATTILRPDQDASTQQSFVMDRHYSITKTVLRKNKNGSLSEGKDVYVLNAEARNFTLIMTDALDDKLTELINPIDTLPRKQKLSADYATGKLNLVSIRDGRKNGRISFFIHFEKNNGECTGELKGEALLRSPMMAEYRMDGDPCVLRFSFTSTSVTLKEEDEACGSHRGMRCLFDGSFPRKKYLKPVSRGIKK